MLTAAVCLVVIAVVALGGKSSRELAALQRATEATEGASYTEALAYLGVSEDHPAGMLVGAWGADPAAEVWWWRCSLCREMDLWLPPEVCAEVAALHVCVPAALEAAKAEAKRQHPAHWDGRSPR